MPEETKDELGKEFLEEDKAAGSPDRSGTQQREIFKALHGSDASAGRSEPTTGSVRQSDPTTGSAPATPPAT